MQKIISQMKGFTFIELIIALLIMGILVWVAIPTYRTYILKGNRADATATLLNLESLQEKYRLTNTTYGSLANIYSTTTTPKGYYNLAVSGTSATGYTLTATATGTQTNDTDCPTFTIVVANGVETKSPSICWQ